MTNKLAIIGGTGLYHLEFLENMETLAITTEYGETTLQKAIYEDTEVYFMTRHGSGHKVPPHLVNYRANIAALKVLEVDGIFATAAVGSLLQDIAPGTMVVVDQFMDQTRDRISTFFTGGDMPVVHTDFTEPYCPELRSLLISECYKAGWNYRNCGTYVTTEGPRFETPAEIVAMSRLGGELVGMTNVPEVVLAREAGLCYSTVALVTNYAAGISENPLTHEEVVEVMKTYKDQLNNLFQSCILNFPREKECSCLEAGQYLNIKGQINKK